MKRLLALILLLSLLVVTGTIVSADGQTRRKKITDVTSIQLNSKLDKLFRTYGGK